MLGLTLTAENCATFPSKTQKEIFILPDTFNVQYKKIVEGRMNENEAKKKAAEFLLFIIQRPIPLSFPFLYLCLSKFSFGSVRFFKLYSDANNNTKHH